MAFWGSKSFGKVTFISRPSLETGESHIISKFQNMACKEINHTCFKSLVFFHQDTGKTRAKHHPILPTRSTAPGSSLIPSSKRWQHRSCLQEPVAAGASSCPANARRARARWSPRTTASRTEPALAASTAKHKVCYGEGVLNRTSFAFASGLFFMLMQVGKTLSGVASTAHHKHLWKNISSTDSLLTSVRLKAEGKDTNVSNNKDK